MKSFLAVIFLPFLLSNAHCPYKLKWTMEKVGTVNESEILGVTDFEFLDKETLITLNFPKEGKESAPLKMYRRSGNSWAYDHKASNKLPFAFHPRHIAIGDLDGDGKNEAIIADHGKDTPPYPGSYPIILKKTGNEWAMDPDSKKISSAFTFNTALIDLDKNKKAIYLGNVSFGTPRVITKEKNGWKDLSSQFPEDLKHLCLMTTLYEDFDGDGSKDLYLGGCDRPQMDPKQKHDRILTKNKSGWTFLSEKTIPARRLDATWGTVFVKSLAINNDNKPDIIVSTHDFGFRNWQIVAYINKSSPGKFNFSEIRIPLVQEKGIEGFVYSLEDFEIAGLGKVIFAQVRRRDSSGNPPVTGTRLLLIEKESFKDISSCLPQLLKAELQHLKKYPDTINKLLMIPFRGEINTISVIKE